MKKHISLLALLGLLMGPLATVAIVAVPAVAFTGCKSTGNAQLTEATAIAKEIEVARKSWARYVVSKRTALTGMEDRNEQGRQLLAINASEVRVKAALENYFAANKAGRDAIAAGVPPPPPSAVITAGKAYLTAVEEEMK